MSEPGRTCIGCRRRRPQAELVRCAISTDDRAVVDRLASGRGAWLCPPPGDCLDQAIRRRAFERAWRRPAPDLSALRQRWAGGT